MHPAYSIIFFTVMSGVGFGALAFLGLGLSDSSGFSAFLFFAVAFAFSVAGLISSTFHLGNPQRALKAFTQWRSSWLSREGCFSVLALSFMGIYAIGVIFFHTRFAVIGYIGAALSLVTIICTAMIYAQLKTVPRWNHWLTPVMFMAYALGGGAVIAGEIAIALWFIAAAGVIQVLYWLVGDGQFTRAGSSLETATGLGKIGKVRLFESPHTGTNYLMTEMVHVVGRKHAVKLRIIGIILAAVVPLLIIALPPYTMMELPLVIGVHLIGAFICRWLFFAEAEHTVGLYYDKRRAS